MTVIEAVELIRMNFKKACLILLKVYRVTFRTIPKKRFLIIAITMLKDLKDFS